jgi:hypothetical protein
VHCSVVVRDICQKLDNASLLETKWTYIYFNIGVFWNSLSQIYGQCASVWLDAVCDCPFALHILDMDIGDVQKTIKN